tara:strand:- start:882 stop:1205 length:324 start_codon:yes stop_codon:yes gene_type:complete
MANEVARGYTGSASGDSGSTNHLCDATFTTDECSSTVIVVNYGVVREDDANASHLVGDDPPCAGHTVDMSADMVSTVIVEDKQLAINGSKYGGENITTVNQTSVFAG